MCGFDESIDVWEWVAVFRARLVQVGEIYADAPFPIFLLYYDRIPQPVRILDFDYRSCFQEFVYLVVYRFCALRS